MNVNSNRWSLLQQAIEKKDADEKPDEGGTDGEDKPSARQVSRGSRAGAKATTKGTARPKAKGGATASAGAPARASAAGDSKTEERKACLAANTLKEKYLKTTSEAAGLQNSLKQDAKYNHLASQHNVATLEKYMQDLASTMMKESAAGEVWRVMVERDHVELKKEITNRQVHADDHGVPESGEAAGDEARGVRQDAEVRPQQAAAGGNVKAREETALDGRGRPCRSESKLSNQVSFNQLLMLSSALVIIQ